MIARLEVNLDWTRVGTERRNAGGKLVIPVPRSSNDICRLVVSGHQERQKYTYIGEAEDLSKLADDAHSERTSDIVQRIGRITGDGGDLELNVINWDRAQVNVNGRWRRLDPTDLIERMLIKIAAQIEAEEDRQAKSLNLPIGRL